MLRDRSAHFIIARAETSSASPNRRGCSCAPHKTRQLEYQLAKRSSATLSPNIRNEERATAALAFWGLHWTRLLITSSFARNCELRWARQSQQDSTAGAQKAVCNRLARVHIKSGTMRFWARALSALPLHISTTNTANLFQNIIKIASRCTSRKRCWDTLLTRVTSHTFSQLSVCNSRNFKIHRSLTHPSLRVTSPE